MRLQGSIHEWRLCELVVPRHLQEKWYLKEPCLGCPTFTTQEAEDVLASEAPRLWSALGSKLS